MTESLEEENDWDDSNISMFECSEPGCVKSFQTFSELESHLDVANHCVKEERPSETLYDKLRRDWVDRFTTSVNVTENEPSEPNIHQSENVSIPALHTVIMGWALHRPRAGSIRLTDKVKKYLTAKFDLGEQSGLKADPQQVSNDMRKTRDEQNRRLFERDEWLTKSQVQGFFSRLAASRRRQQAHSEIEHNPKELFLEEKEAERQQLMAHISNELRPQHPLSYDAFNLCECARDNKLSLFNVSLLKEILHFFEIPFKSKNRKKDLIEQLMSFIQEFQCFNEV